MRAFDIAVIAILTMGLGACARRDADDTSARKAGRAAYDLAQETKEAAKKAGTKLKETGHELHEGWKEAKHDAKDSGRK